MKFSNKGELALQIKEKNSKMAIHILFTDKKLIINVINFIQNN